MSKPTGFRVIESNSKARGHAAMVSSALDQHDTMASIFATWSGGSGFL